MRDFPIFDTRYGVASLVLRDVPYWECAYIKLLSTREPEKLLSECADFCKAVGAEHIYATGEVMPEKYPTYATLVKLRCSAAHLPVTDAVAVPVTEQSLPQWKQIYNQKMAAVPNASYMDDARGRELLEEASGYMVYKGDTLIGIGKACDNTVHAVAAVLPGAGQDTLCALAQRLQADVIELLVATENERAMALYQRLGFTVSEEVSRWHKIL